MHIICIPHLWFTCEDSFEYRQTDRRSPSPLLKSCLSGRYFPLYSRVRSLISSMLTTDIRFGYYSWWGNKLCLGRREIDQFSKGTHWGINQQARFFHRERGGGGGVKAPVLVHYGPHDLSRRLSLYFFSSRSMRSDTAGVLCHQCWQCYGVRAYLLRINYTQLFDCFLRRAAKIAQPPLVFPTYQLTVHPL